MNECMHELVRGRVTIQPRFTWLQSQSSHPRLRNKGQGTLDCGLCHSLS